MNSALPTSEPLEDLIQDPCPELTDVSVSPVDEGTAAAERVLEDAGFTVADVSDDACSVDADVYVSETGECASYESGDMLVVEESYAHMCDDGSLVLLCLSNTECTFEDYAGLERFCRATDGCGGLDCVSCLDYVPSDDESFCAYVEGTCMLASDIPVDATDAVWDTSMCDSQETTGQTLECGSTMEECNQAYLDASSVTCTTAEPASLYTPTNSGLTETATPASNWMFNQQNNNGEVQLALGLGDGGNSLAVIEDDAGNQ